MKNLYLVTLNSNTRILIVASEKNIAEDYCLPIMHFGEWIESIEFIAVVGGDFQEGEILKKFVDFNTAPNRYFRIEFSSYEDYVKYLKEKGFAIEGNEVMAQEQKELLLKDLCARLPYGV